MKRYHTFISGRVQHVFFRYNVKKQAEKLNINGWIRNLPNGDVEAMFEGNEKELKKMIDYCHKGPILAKVKKVEIKEEKPKKEEGFEVVY